MRRNAAGDDAQDHRARQPKPVRPVAAVRGHASGLRLAGHSQHGLGSGHASEELRRQAWQWALANRAKDGTLPSGEAIARVHGRHERWGRLVKNAGLAGAFGTENAQLPCLVADEGRNAASSSP